jgi:hypothetical protein
VTPAKELVRRRLAASLAEALEPDERLLVGAPCVFGRLSVAVAVVVAIAGVVLSVATLLDWPRAAPLWFRAGLYTASYGVVFSLVLRRGYLAVTDRRVFCMRSSWFLARPGRVTLSGRLEDGKLLRAKRGWLLPRLVYRPDGRRVIAARFPFGWTEQFEWIHALLDGPGRRR